LKTRILVATLLCGCVAACGRSTDPVAVTVTVEPVAAALVGATLIDGTGAAPVPDAVLIVESGRITCAASRADCGLPEDAAVIDLSGRWITPGIVDAHVHFSQTAWADGRPDAIDVRALYPYAEVQSGLRSRPERFFRAYLCSGVTAVFDVGGYPWTWDLRSRAEEDVFAPHVVAAGPLVSQVNPPQLRLVAEAQFIDLSDSEAGRSAVRYLAGHGTDAVKVWFIAPSEAMRSEIDARVRAVAAEASRYDLPLIVHATTLREAKVAVRAGARVLVHSVEDQPVDDEFVELLKDNDVIYTPTLVVRDGYARMYEAAYTGKPPPPVDDPNRCVDALSLERIRQSADVGAYISEERGDYANFERRRALWADSYEVMVANLRILHAAGVTIAMGTDAGNPLTVAGPSVYREMEAMQAAGLSAMDVIVAATRHGAEALGRAADLGTLEPGKVADLLILTADPSADVVNFRQLQAVMRAGTIHPLSILTRDGSAAD
jgi:imidazolonepropionase-like amidohydrolase